MGAISQTQKEIQKFKEISIDQQTQKKAWIETSEKLSDLYEKLNEKLNSNKKQIKKTVLQGKNNGEVSSHEEIGDSELVRDAIETSLSCIDRIPVLDNIQENYGKLRYLKENMENNSLLSNLQKLVTSKDEEIKMNTLSEDLIFKDLLDVQKEELYPKLLINPKQNKKAICLENLIDQANRQTSDAIHMLEQDKKVIKMEKLKESILDLKKLHQNKLDQVRKFNESLEQKLAV